MQSAYVTCTFPSRDLESYKQVTQLGSDTAISVWPGWRLVAPLRPYHPIFSLQVYESFLENPSSSGLNVCISLLFHLQGCSPVWWCTCILVLHILVSAFLCAPCLQRTLSSSFPCASSVRTLIVITAFPTFPQTYSIKEYSVVIAFLPEVGALF